MGKRVSGLYGSNFLQFYNIGVSFHCHFALRTLLSDTAHYNALTQLHAVHIVPGLGNGRTQVLASKDHMGPAVGRVNGACTGYV